MNAKFIVRLFLFSAVYCLLCGSAVYAGGTGWSGVIDPSRAIDWSNAGASIPVNSTICATLNPGAAAAQINAALASAACSGGTASNPKVVLLNAGTYNLSAGIEINGLSNVVLRGAGADQTLLVMSASGGCNGQAADFCVRTVDNNWSGSPDNTATFTGSGPWPKGTTQITLSSVSNLKVGGIMTIDQIDDLTDPGTIYVCEESPSKRPGQNPNCNEDNNGTGGDSGAQRGSGTTSPRGQQQIVTVTAINGNTVTFTPGLYMPNWRASQFPGAWWDSNPVSGDGIENLSIQHAPGNLNIILFSNASNCWVKGVRSIMPDRSHVSLWTSAKITIRDSYFYQTANGVSQSYGVETFGASDVREENNIFQQVAAPQMFNSDCEGCVAGYGFSINDYYSASFDWLQQGMNFHSSVMGVLLEGNVGSGLYSDRFHGTSHFSTMFRNRFDGFEKNGTQSPTSHTNPLIFYPFSRYMNVIGNVLGSTARPHITYQNVPGSSPNPDQTVYIAGTGAGFVPDDPMTVNSLMRWGNYDVVNGAVRFLASEVPSGLSVYANPVPSNNALPASFYFSSKPSWWPAAKPWPAIGPDVTGGSIANVGGHANTIPAQDCYADIMGGPSDGTGNVLNFNAANCYGAPPIAPVITSALTASGTVGSAFSYQITASNSPTSFNATGLPTGLTINTSNGLISGTPTAAGSFNVAVNATNSGGTGTATLALTVGSSGGGKTITAASCSQVDVQNAVNSANAGDTVVVPAGNCTWTATVTINKGLTIKVAAGQTATLTSNSASSPAFFTITGTGSNFVHISGDNGTGDCKTSGPTTGCGLVLVRRNDPGYVSSAIQITGPVLSFRLDHIQGNKGDAFLYSNNDGSATGEVHGVIDHSYLLNYNRTYFAQNQQSTDGTFNLGCPGGSNGETSWHNFLGHQMSYAGTGNLIYFEDDQFNWTAAPASPGQGAFYSQYGGMVVIRHNIIGGWSEEITDEADNPACGSVYYEVYNNTITENCGLTGFGCEGKIFDIRSGNGLYHDNAFITKDPSGTSTPAALVTYPNGGPKVSGHNPNNIYWWNNTWDSGSGAQACQSDSNPSGAACVIVDPSSETPVPHRIIGAASGCSDSTCYYLRPPATAGDVFFGYTPYTYPHPLTGGSTPPLDTTPPTVGITSPVNGATVSGTITVSGTAADNVAVASVQVSIDGGAYAAASGTTNWTFSLNTTSLTNASHTISAKATDTSGNISAVASISVMVNNSTPPPLAPVITSALTAFGTVGSAFSYQITASNSPTSFNATSLPSGLSINTATGLISGIPIAAGTSSITLSATNAGGTGTAALTLTVNTAVPPTVSLVPLSTTTLSGTVTLTASASSNLGIASVQFQLDGANLGSPITAPPFALSWNTLQAPAGTHSLTAIATDTSGNKTTSAPITVTVVRGADATPGLRSASVYPNPAVKQDPTIRAFLGTVNSVEITIFDASGRVVHSSTLAGAPMGILNGEYYYDYKWTGSKASGTYFAVIHGKAADGTVIRARTRFAVVW